MKDQADQVKSRTNIIDVIGGYVPLKRQGKDYFGCCPFHGEKTPSFSVNESKQFFHCFGCGASGDVIDFIKEYTGSDFKEAIKLLGGVIELTPTKKIKQNQSRKILHFSPPPDHKQDPELAAKFLHQCEKRDLSGSDMYTKDGEQYLPVFNAMGELLNVAKLGYPSEFLAGGISYTGFSAIRKNQDNKWLMCVNPFKARWLSDHYNCNVLISYTDHNMKYIIRNCGDMKIKPVLTHGDDDFLAHEMNYLYLDNKTITKKLRIEE